MESRSVPNPRKAISQAIKLCRKTQIGGMKMATLTAQILVGSPHFYHDGINPTHYLYLSENNRPAWVLVHQNIFDEKQLSTSKITWIPTAEDMLEDALLMIAIHVCKDREILEYAKSFNAKFQKDWLEVYADFKETQRKHLYEKCRAITDFPKVIISVFEGSTLEKQLPVLNQYKMNVEVCRVSYSRLHSSMTNDLRINGSLD
jgi:hypothetical protein